MAKTEILAVNNLSGCTTTSPHDFRMSPQNPATSHFPMIAQQK
jgi:hypothetical protein